MPYQQNRADASYYAQKIPRGSDMSAAYYGGMKGTACGCGGQYQARPVQGCTLAAPAPHVAACMPAAFHAGMSSTFGAGSWSGNGGGAHQKLRVAYGY